MGNGWLLHLQEVAWILGDTLNVLINVLFEHPPEHPTTTGQFRQFSYGFNYVNSRTNTGYLGCLSLISVPVWLYSRLIKPGVVTFVWRVPSNDTNGDDAERITLFMANEACTGTRVPEVPLSSFGNKSFVSFIRAGTGCFLPPLRRVTYPLRLSFDHFRYLWGSGELPRTCTNAGRLSSTKIGLSRPLTASRSKYLDRSRVIPVQLVPSHSTWFEPIWMAGEIVKRWLFYGGYHPIDFSTSGNP